MYLLHRAKVRKRGKKDGYVFGVDTGALRSLILREKKSEGKPAVTRPSWSDLRRTTQKAGQSRKRKRGKKAVKSHFTDGGGSRSETEKSTEEAHPLHGLSEVPG